MDALIGKLVSILETGLVCNGSVLVKTEAIKLLQDLSVVASSGYEGIFRKVVDCIVTNVLLQNEQQPIIL